MRFTWARATSLQWMIARLSERTPRSSLSPRELQILEMVAKGLTNKEIGCAIQVSHFTVRNHVRHIIAKLEVGDRTEAALRLKMAFLWPMIRFQVAEALANPRPANRRDRFLGWPSSPSPAAFAPDRSRERPNKLVRGDRRVLGPIRSVFQVQ